MNRFAEWLNGLWNQFMILCTGETLFWISAVLLAGVALLICYLRHRNRS